MTKEELIAFEKEVARRYDAGEIRAPIHLSGGNEEHLIDIFKNVSPNDWVLSTWRNHYHALLHGIPPAELMEQIVAGRSMFVNDPARRFYASSIAGGILPIAVGLAMAIKRVKRGCDDGSKCCHCRCSDLNCRTLLSFSSDGGHIHYDHLPCPAWSRHVWCFVGDMVAEMGIFHEARKYAENFELPVIFVVEDNGQSVLTSTIDAWGLERSGFSYIGVEPHVMRYAYSLEWPHHGTGTQAKAF